MGEFKDWWNDSDDDAEFKPPKGSYEVEVAKADVFTSANGSWAKVHYRIVGGDHSGRVFEDFGPFGPGAANPVGARIMKERLIMLGLSLAGVEDPDIDDVAHAAGELVGNRADVGVSYNAKGYLQLNVRSSRTGRSDISAQDTLDVGAAPASKPASAVGHDDDADIPFAHDGFPSYGERRAHASRW